MNKNRSLADSMANEIYQYNGFTWSPSLGYARDTNVKDFPRYICGIESFSILTGTDSLSESEAKRFIETAVQRNILAGGWKESATKKVYYDFSVGFESLTEALAYAQEKSEIAIFDLHTSTEILV